MDEKKENFVGCLSQLRRPALLADDVVGALGLLNPPGEDGQLLLTTRSKLTGTGAGTGAGSDGGGGLGEPSEHG